MTDNEQTMQDRLGKHLYQVRMGNSRALEMWPWGVRAEIHHRSDNRTLRQRRGDSGRVTSKKGGK